LRERDKDIDKLARLLVEGYAAKHGRNVDGFSKEALSVLRNYDFPGNVRELANTIERAVIVSTESCIEMRDLPEALQAPARMRERKHRLPSLAAVEAGYISATLLATRGNKAQAARILGISRKNLYERLARLKE